jgi:hypothetical protein
MSMSTTPRGSLISNNARDCIEKAPSTKKSHGEPTREAPPLLAFLTCGSGQRAAAAAGSPASSTRIRRPRCVISPNLALLRAPAPIAGPPQPPFPRDLPPESLAVWRLGRSDMPHSRRAGAWISVSCFGVGEWG